MSRIYDILLLLRRVGTRSLTDALKWWNSWLLFFRACVLFIVDFNCAKGTNLVPGTILAEFWLFKLVWFSLWILGVPKVYVVTFWLNFGYSGLRFFLWISGVPMVYVVIFWLNFEFCVILSVDSRCGEDILSTWYYFGWICLFRACYCKLRMSGVLNIAYLVKMLDQTNHLWRMLGSTHFYCSDYRLISGRMP